MPDSLAKLLRLIPSGTTEGELGFLSEVFVLPAELREILSIPQGNPRLLVGRKGTGKTAILEYLHLRLAERGIPSVLLRPDDLPLPNDEFKSVGDAKRRAYAELVLATASAVGKYTTFAKTDAERSLLLAAKQRGERGDDLIEKACKMLIPVGALLADIDFGAWIQDAAVTEHGLVTALRDVLSKETGRFVFVLVDDVDQIGRADTSDYTTRIWGLLLAIRKLASENRAIRAIVALRSEVWMRLEWDGIGAEIRSIISCL
ncbi:MAG: hypothetical protein IPN32_07875 [Deltaproteobacteria bacterium]|nr:hypothetical protein [Deltaproteobacteria bacterium]